MWKDIKGFEGLYQVSDTGKVKRISSEVTSITGQKYIVPGRMLKTTLTGRGYPTVTLSKQGKVKRYYVHRLVAEAFIPNPENKPTVNHINGNKLQSNVENLEWSTYSDNNQHAYNTGLKASGEGQYKAKLTEEDVKKIKKQGKYTTYQNIADEYNVSKATVRDVLTGKTWKNIS